MSLVTCHLQDWNYEEGYWSCLFLQGTHFVWWRYNANTCFASFLGYCYPVNLPKFWVSQLMYFLLIGCQERCSDRWPCDRLWCFYRKVSFNFKLWWVCRDGLSRRSWTLGHELLVVLHITVDKRLVFKFLSALRFTSLAKIYEKRYPDIKIDIPSEIERYKVKRRATLI